MREREKKRDNLPKEQQEPIEMTQNKQGPMARIPSDQKK